MSNFKVLLFYKYTTIDNPKALMDSQRALCQRLDLKGRIIIAKEGINATVEGKTEDIKEYISEVEKDPRMQGIDFKISEGTGKAFPKISVKVRNEIVAGRLGDEDINPAEVSGKYIYAKEPHKWIQSGKEFYIVDMRNAYEQEVGHFESSILTKMESFADLPKVTKDIEHLRGKIVVTVCTGGVRCEKASGFLVQKGFAYVYQLYGGIVTYMEEYPNEDFKGALYVFDNRLIMHFEEKNKAKKREIVGKCAKCSAPSENFINCIDHFCHRHMIICKDCLNGKDAILCPMGCRDYSREHPEVFL